METPTETITAAIQFINSTSSHIFLTGKAGTGKTTFLRNLFGQTHKQFAIVAPTGIAALNAGGVTIHSQFLLPFGMFIPDRNVSDGFGVGSNFYSPGMLSRQHPINSERKQVLRSIDLLVIDEVSMLRADLLDAIDYRMKSARGNFSQSFGGVQLLLIGDLYQLPPVVKRDEENVLKRYYNSAWFFESKALKQDGFVYIELDKIFRQHDQRFIDLLNNLRNNIPTRADIDELNKYYKPAEEIQHLSEVITLTTHNYKADELNLRALRELKTDSHILHATVEGNFPESMFPVQQHLELKVGTQIMFTKNDNEGKMYFNGKLATVKKISGDDITVELAGSHIDYTLKKELWENKRYTLNATTQDLDDEVIGTFTQYPVKLAWAITVHKSQGLTFDKAIIDISEAFADGQVYVALSRLRSLDGLIMRTSIDPSVISTDRQIVNFTKENNQPAALTEIMKSKQLEYIRHLATKTFDFDHLIKETAYIQRSRKDIAGFEEQTMKPVLEQIGNAMLAEKENTEKFRRQLSALLQGNDQQQLLERLKKGSEYYRNILVNQLNTLLAHLEEMKQKKRMKTYVNNLSDLDQLFCKKLEEVDKAVYLAETIFSGQHHYDFSKLSEQRAKDRAKTLVEIRSKMGTDPEKKKKAKKKKKGDPNTMEVTIRLLESGLNIDAIAKERGLVRSTIEGHFAKAVEIKRISIYAFLSQQQVNQIEAAIKEMPEDFTSKDLFAKLRGEFSYSQLRAVVNRSTLVLDHPVE